MKKKCPNCGSTKLIELDDYQIYITFDETATVIQYLCDNCDYEWDA